MDEQVTKELNELLADDKKVTDIDEEYDFPIYKSSKVINDNKVLILSGGGVKGIAYVGAFRALEEMGYMSKFKTYAGTSVGALMLALLNVGYTSDELYRFIKSFNMQNMKDISFMNLQLFGLDKGDKLTYVLNKLITAKKFNPNITLKELHNKTDKTLILTTTCLNTLKVEYLSWETYPELPLLKAIRMSISVPWFYTPVSHNGLLYIDGGCIDNYPINLFKDRLNDIVGIYLVETVDQTDYIGDLETYTMRVIQCFMEGMNFNSKKAFEKHTIEVHLDYINIVDFASISNKRDDMYKRGYEAVINHLKKNIL